MTSLLWGVLAALVAVTVGAGTVAHLPAPGAGSREACSGGRCARVVRIGPLAGMVVELHGGARGVDALRVGTVRPGPLTGSGSIAWRAPAGDAVFLERGWWTPVARLRPVAGTRPGDATLARVRIRLAPRDDGRGHDRLYEAALGDVTADGRTDLVVAFRRPFQRTFINASRPAWPWRDRAGMSAHIGVYAPRSLRERWVAGTLVHPVVRLAACDGAIAVAYGSLAGPGITATGAWRWQGFGFLPGEALPGRGRPVCVDIDDDGRTEPAIQGRESP